MSSTGRDVGNWLRQAQGGSQEALGNALESCRAYLLLVANRELDTDLRTKGGPSDIVQETFLEAQRDFARFEGGTVEELRVWLRQILLHNLANFARAYRATGKRNVGLERGGTDTFGPGATAEPASGTSWLPDRPSLAAEAALALEAAIGRLPDDYREIIRLRHREEMEFPDIARHMGRSENAARKVWFRAIERLKHELEADQAT